MDNRAEVREFLMSRRAKMTGLACLAVVPVLLVACNSASDRTNTTSSTANAVAADDDSATPMSTSPVGATRFRVTFGATTLTGHFFDNTTARDLASQLPLTLNFRDLNGLEKTAPLPRALSVDGMPDGEDPQVSDLGYWAPDGDLVLYYGDVGYFTGIMRIGVVEGDMQAVAQQSGDFSATIELAR